MKTITTIILAIILFVGCKKEAEEVKADPEVNLEGTVWDNGSYVATFTNDSIFSLNQKGTGGVYCYKFQKPNTGTYGTAATIDKDSVRHNEDSVRYFSVFFYISNDSLYSTESIGITGKNKYAWGKRK